MKKILLFFALAVGLLTSATLQAQVNMSSYITLTVKSGEAISLDLKAAATGTPVRIVSGSNTQDITVGTDWTGFISYTAGSTVMTVYGDIISFDCSNNGANITALDLLHNTQLTELLCNRNAINSLNVSGCTQLTRLDCDNNNLSSLDVSHNTQLKILYCFGNAFTTAALDDIYCALPNRTGKVNGEIYTLCDTSSVAEQAIVEATNATNATAKNWKVRKHNGSDNPVITTTGTYTCPQNMNRYITLTVGSGKVIKLDFKAVADGTPVRIVSGSNTQDITVGTVWEGTTYYTADGTEMKVYGDIIGFDCQGNGANLTAIDVSHNTLLEVLLCQGNRLSILDVSKNTQLTELYCYRNQLSSLDISKNTQLGWLYCYGNNFSTAALDDIYCTLPDRTGTTNGKIQPVYSDTSSNHATVLATNKQNAIAKNWKVQYENYTDIPATTGTYVCGTPHLDIYITLTVAKDSAIRLNFKAAAEGTPVRIVSGSNTQNITVGTDWYYGSNPSFFTVTADGTEMKVYGNIVAFRCNNNQANLTAIDVSNNTQLIELDCYSNQLSNLDVSKNTQLTSLDCSENKLNDLDVSKNTKLTSLGCSKNNLSSLDVSKNTQLTELFCLNNKLSSLDVSRNTQLEELYCWGNNFTTDALDDIYCALPDRTGKYSGKIFPLRNTSSVAEQAIVEATNASNATAKNWKVRKFRGFDDPDIATTGTYTCPPNMSRYITLTVKSGKAIRLDFEAAADGTPVRIESGSNTQDITVGTDWKGATYYTADGTKMKIYGNIIGFDCNDNEDNITALDVSHNTLLTKLYCNKNNLSSLDVSKNTQLTWLYCNKNNLSHLDISKNTALTVLSLWGNKFSTATLDAIYCRIPDMTGQPRKGYILPIHETSSATEQNNVDATNANNATDKNWRVVIYKNDDTIDDITTTGTYDCSTAVAEASAEPLLTLYPNPVADVLYLSATARTIRIYNIYGIEVAHATDTDRVEVAHLPAGVYTVRADGMVAKMVKR